MAWKAWFKRMDHIPFLMDGVSGYAGGGVVYFLLGKDFKGRQKCM